MLTSHVSTRIYRAPEVILIEKNYNKAIDIWACGVILSEMFKKIENINDQIPDESFHIFSGQFCFPLSPNPNNTIGSDGLPKMSGDITKTIFAFMGTPDKYDMSFITDEQAKLYIKKFKKRLKVDHKVRFPNICDHGLNLMRQMLAFNPFLRLDVD